MDKLQHLIVSAAIVIIGTHLAGLYGGIGIAITFSILKEASDKHTTGWDWTDILFDITGIALGIALVLPHK